MNSNQQKISHTNEIASLMINDLKSCEDEILILSAYVKLETLKWIDQNIKSLKRKYLLVRFQKSDIIFGATDFDIVRYCYENEWKIKFDLKLHSKIYIFDQKNFIIGSANVTQRGLSLAGENSNIETVVSGQLIENDFNKIYQIYNSATFFSKEILIFMEEEMQKEEDITSKSDVWSNDIISKINKPSKFILMREDLLTSSNISEMTEEDKVLLGLENMNYLEKQLILDQFLNSKIYLWLLIKLKESDSFLYFGKISQLLHEDIALNERIQRSEIKLYVVNLINWIVQLNLSNLIVDRPKHSQRIRLLE